MASSSRVKEGMSAHGFVKAHILSHEAISLRQPVNAVIGLALQGKNNGFYPSVSGNSTCNKDADCRT